VIEIRLEDGVFFAVCSYEDRNVPKNAGFEFDRILKRWQTPSIDKAILLLDFAVGDAKDALEQRQRIEDNMVEASMALETDTEYWHPEGLAYLPFQRAGIEFMLNTKDCILADDMGTGKTIQCLGVVSNSSAKDVLIVVTASMKYKWLMESKKWLPKSLTCGVTESLAVKNKETGRSHTEYLWPDTNVVITTYDMLEAYHDKLRERIWDVRIADEAHKLSNKKTIMTRNFFGGGRGKKKLMPIVSRKTIFATGTPIWNRPIDMWNMIEYCDPHGLGKDWIKFIKRYCAAYETRFGDVNGWFTSGSDNEAELQKMMRSRFMLRREKEDVLKDLPPKTRNIVFLPPDGLKKVVKKELKIWEDNLSALEGLNGTIEERPEVSIDALASFVEKARQSSQKFDVSGEGVDLEDYLKLHFEAMAAAREEVGLGKANMVVEFVQSILREGKKAVIMAVHRSVVAELKKAFPQAAVISGGVSAKKRADEEFRFQNDPACNVFIGNIMAAAEGLTLTAADHLVFAELEWVPAKMFQAEDRIHRIGQTLPSTIHYLVVIGSMEAALVEALIDKQAAISKVLNKDRN